MYQSVHLQGIGAFRAIPAGQLKPGDITMWNHGSKQTVHSIRAKGASVWIVWKDVGKDGIPNLYPEQRYSATRLIGYPTQPGEKK